MIPTWLHPLIGSITQGGIGGAGAGAGGNGLTASSFIVATRMKSPLGTLGAVPMGGAADAYSPWIAPFDMVLETMTARVSRSAGLRESIEFFIRVNDGTAVSLGTFGVTGAAGYITFNPAFSITAGDKVELLFTCANNYNLGVGVAFYFKAGTGANGTFLLRSYETSLGSSRGALAFGGSGGSYLTFPTAPVAFTVKRVTYYNDQAALADQTFEFLLDGVAQTAQQVLVGGRGRTIDTDISVTAGQTLECYVNGNFASSGQAEMVLACEFAGNAADNNHSVIFMSSGDIKNAGSWNYAPMLMPQAGKIIGVSAGSQWGYSSNLNVSVNGGADSTLLSYSLSGTGDSVSGVVDVPFAEGDTLEFKHTGSGITGAGGNVAITLEFTGTSNAAGAVDPPAAAGEHKWWRVFCEAMQNASYYGIAEIEMRLAASGVDVATYGEAVAGVDRGAGKTAGEAFNDDGTDYWGAGPNPVAADAWAGQKFITPRKIVELSLLARNNSYSDQMPTQFKVEYSDDGVVWTTALARGIAYGI